MWWFYSVKSGIHKKHPKKSTSAPPPPPPSRDTEMFLNEALRHSHRAFTALSRANTSNHTSFSFRERRILPRQTGVHSDDQRSTKRHQQRARWLRRGYAWTWKHRRQPLGDTPQDRKERGQHGSLVQWKPEELLSLTVQHSCALWEVSAHWSLG